MWKFVLKVKRIVNVVGNRVLSVFFMGWGDLGLCVMLFGI